EDNYPGGLDAELAAAITQSHADLTLKSLSVHNIPKSGRQPEDVLAYVHLDSPSILRALP
ncbi:MAG TPA: hypothetical protein VHP11_15235, partial [Tepidisphaeraceae bacterium]|nr:hypothetical protein [Tepidisphaeraceae bacterium]